VHIPNVTFHPQWSYGAVHVQEEVTMNRVVNSNDETLPGWSPNISPRAGQQRVSATGHNGLFLTPNLSSNPSFNENNRGSVTSRPDGSHSDDEHEIENDLLIDLHTEEPVPSENSKSWISKWIPRFSFLKPRETHIRSNTVRDELYGEINDKKDKDKDKDKDKNKESEKAKDDETERTKEREKKTKEKGHDEDDEDDILSLKSLQVKAEKSKEKRHSKSHSRPSSGQPNEKETAGEKKIVVQNEKLEEITTLDKLNEKPKEKERSKKERREKEKDKGKEKQQNNEKIEETKEDEKNKIGTTNYEPESKITREDMLVVVTPNDDEKAQTSPQFLDEETPISQNNVSKSASTHLLSVSTGKEDTSLVTPPKLSKQLSNQDKQAIWSEAHKRKISQLSQQVVGSLKWISHFSGNAAISQFPIQNELICEGKGLFLIDKQVCHLEKIYIHIHLYTHIYIYMYIILIIVILPKINEGEIFKFQLEVRQTPDHTQWDQNLWWIGILEGPIDEIDGVEERQNYPPMDGLGLCCDRGCMYHGAKRLRSNLGVPVTGGKNLDIEVSVKSSNLAVLRMCVSNSPSIPKIHHTIKISGDCVCVGLLHTHSKGHYLIWTDAEDILIMWTFFSTLGLFFVSYFCAAIVQPCYYCFVFFLFFLCLFDVVVNAMHYLSLVDVFVLSKNLKKHLLYISKNFVKTKKIRH
ncbi:PHD zinc finger-containing protein, partial [Reticulomyxa filosa]